MRLLRLRYYFGTRDPNTDTERVDTATNDPFDQFCDRKSSWTPLPGASSTLDHYIDKSLREIGLLHHTPLTRSNLTREEWSALSSLRSRHDIVIKPADKGGAVVVWGRDMYEAESQRQLRNSNFYSAVPSDPTVHNNTVVKTSILSLIQNVSLPPQASRLAFHPSDLGNPSFYLLPKIHKISSPADLPPGRPIVSAISCPTERISQFLDSVFQGIIPLIPSYVKDTNHALRLLDSTRFSGPSRRLIFTMDVCALYTSIPHPDGLRAVRHYIDLYPLPNCDTTPLSASLNWSLP